MSVKCERTLDELTVQFGYSINALRLAVLSCHLFSFSIINGTSRLNFENHENYFEPALLIYIVHKQNEIWHIPFNMVCITIYDHGQDNVKCKHWTCLDRHAQLYKYIPIRRGYTYIVYKLYQNHTCQVGEVQKREISLCILEKREIMSEAIPRHVFHPSIFKIWQKF